MEKGPTVIIRNIIILYKISFKTIFLYKANFKMFTTSRKHLPGYVCLISNKRHHYLTCNQHLGATINRFMCLIIIPAADRVTVMPEAVPVSGRVRNLNV